MYEIEIRETRKFMMTASPRTELLWKAECQQHLWVWLSTLSRTELKANCVSLRVRLPRAEITHFHLSREERHRQVSLFLLRIPTKGFNSSQSLTKDSNRQSPLPPRTSFQLKPFIYISIIHWTTTNFIQNSFHHLCFFSKFLWYKFISYGPVVIPMVQM